jgi:nucleoside-diphosphate-sugar epimerase
MRVLVTGHHGYIGSILTGVLSRAGHDVVGCDNFLFEGCDFGEDSSRVPSLRKDVRDLGPDDLEGFEAICHLAGISNDPIGDLSPDATYEINHRASVALAKLASESGVERFLFSSSCSIYGASPGQMVDELSPVNPVTPYGWSKIMVEDDVKALASDEFTPVFLRNATAYGVSPRLRADLVVNNLVGYAVTQGKVTVKSDGTPWRPMVHIEDISRAFAAMLVAPREKVHNEIFNIGTSTQNFQISQVASMVERAVPGATVEFAGTAGPDIRDYRVDCSKVADLVPEFQPAWTVESGVEELVDAYRRHGLEESEFLGNLMRIEHIKRLLADGRIGADLRLEPMRD